MVTAENSRQLNLNKLEHLLIGLVVGIVPAIAAGQGGGAAAGRPVIGGPVGPDGKTAVTCDLPVEMRHANRGGRDGAGLCVFASIDHAALWQNDRKVIGLFQNQSPHGSPLSARFRAQPALDRKTTR